MESVRSARASPQCRTRQRLPTNSRETDSTGSCPARCEFSSPREGTIIADPRRLSRGEQMIVGAERRAAAQVSSRIFYAVSNVLRGDLERRLTAIRQRTGKE